MATVKSRSALVLAGLLVAGAAALMPAAEAPASGRYRQPYASVAARSPVPAAPLPLGLYQSSNNAQYSFPVTPAYAIQYYGWYEPFQTADAQAAWNAGTETFVELQTCGNPCNASTVFRLPT